ncbi:MAG TPA: TonB-dependent receptor [Thermoanaerobaculia bacterium]|nr:TonB-dependent receptor [Thermoanaerobaculia bacterium]
MLHLVLAAAACALAPAPPPDPAQEPPRVQEQIVVTAERGPETRGDVPAATSVLTREEISRIPAETLADLLAYLPGFHSFFAHPGAGTPPMVTARGFFGGGEAEYVQLRIDGVPVSDPESGIADWRRIRAGDIERIEALRGPASALYGDTALGGVLEVFTRRPPAEGVEGGGAVSAGSFGAATAEASVLAGRAGREARVSANLARSDGERAHSATETAGADARVAADAGGGRLSLGVSGASYRREDPGALLQSKIDADPFASDPAYRFDRESTRRGRAVIGWTVSEGPVPWRAVLDGGARRTELVRSLPLAPGLFDRTRRDLDTSDAGVTLDAERLMRLPGGDGRLRAGIEARRERLDGEYRPVGATGAEGAVSARASGDRNRFAGFLQQDWRPSQRLRVVGAIRWDRIDDRFHGDASGSAVNEAWSPRLGVNVRLGDLAKAPLSVFAGVSRAFKAPTLDQLFDPHPFPDFRGGSFTVSNPELRPQRAVTIEAGVSRETPSLRYEASVYRTQVREEIDFDPATFRYVNIGRSLHRGVEAAARWRVLPDFEPFFSWAWTSVEALDGADAGRQLKNVPRQIIRGGAAISLPAGVRMQAVASALAGRYLDDANRFPLRNAAIVDVRVERDFGRLTARLDLWNAGNSRAEEIGFVLSDFRGRDVPYAYPGARRSLRAGIAYRP